MRVTSPDGRYLSEMKTRILRSGATPDEGEAMSSPYTRHIKPKGPESLPMRIWGYIGAGIA